MQEEFPDLSRFLIAKSFPGSIPHPGDRGRQMLLPLLSQVKNLYPTVGFVQNPRENGSCTSCLPGLRLRDGYGDQSHWAPYWQIPVLGSVPGLRLL